MEIGTKRLRAVLDTTVYVSAFLSSSVTSPTQELLDRWANGEFELLVSNAIAREVVEKLSEINR